MGWFKWSGLSILCLVIWGVMQLPDDRVHVVFCDVGQGDSELIVKGEAQILIDGGPDQNRVLECLAEHIPFWDRRIELVINTHPQKDHLEGLIAVVDRYEVDKLVINQVNTKYAGMASLVGRAGERGVELYSPKKGDRLKVGELSMEVLWPETGVLGMKTYDGDLNELSIVTRLEYGDFEVMFTGDIGEKEELAMVGSGVLMPVEVMKMPHHGSKYSSSLEFVEALRPKITVAEVGERNNFGHPNGDIVKRYEMVGSVVRRTDEDGTVEVVSDGNRWWVEE